MEKKTNGRHPSVLFRTQITVGRSIKENDATDGTVFVAAPISSNVQELSWKLVP